MDIELLKTRLYLAEYYIQSEALNKTSFTDQYGNLIDSFRDQYGRFAKTVKENVEISKAQLSKMFDSVIKPKQEIKPSDITPNIRKSIEDLFDSVGEKLHPQTKDTIKTAVKNTSVFSFKNVLSTIGNIVDKTAGVTQGILSVEAALNLTIGLCVLASAIATVAFTATALTVVTSSLVSMPAMVAGAVLIPKILSAARFFVEAVILAQAITAFDMVKTNLKPEWEANKEAEKQLRETLKKSNIAKGNGSAKKKFQSSDYEEVFEGLGVNPKATNTYGQSKDDPKIKQYNKEIDNYKEMIIRSINRIIEKQLDPNSVPGNREIVKLRHYKDQIEKIANNREDYSESLVKSPV